MRKYHFCNLSPLNSFFDLWNMIQPLCRVWSSPTFQLSRISVKNAIISRKLISDFFPLMNFPSKISLSLNTAFHIEKYIENFNQIELPILTEICVGNSDEQLDSLQIFLQDKFPELKNKIKPKFSLVHNSYEIDYNPKFTSKKPSLKKTRSSGTPRWFQKIITNNLTIKDPTLSGTEYYGHNVFQTYRSLFLNQVRQIFKKKSSNLNSTIVQFTKKTDNRKLDDNYDLNDEKANLLFQNSIDLLPALPFPPKPLKYLDFTQSFPEAITISYQNQLDDEVFPSIMQILDSIYINDKETFLNIRIGMFLEKWQTEMFYKSGNRDKYLFSFWDPELALKERNFQKLSRNGTQTKSNYNPDYSKIDPSLYFQLTSLMEEEDFRVQILQDIFQNQIYLR